MRTEYNEGDLLTKEDIGLVFKGKNGKKWRIINFLLHKESYPFIGLSDCGSLMMGFSLHGIAQFSTYELVSFVGPYFTEDKKELPNV